MKKDEIRELYFDLMRAYAKAVNDDLDPEIIAELDNAIYALRKEKECDI